MQKLLLALLAVAIALFSGPLSAEVQLTSGKYHETVEDLRVKVLGGFVILDRTWYEGRWQFNRRWNPLTLRYDTLDGSLKSIERNGDSYEKVDTAGTVFKFGKRLTITVIATGFRWQDREGNGIEYDKTGRLTAYGDRNNVKVTVTYDQAGRLTGVLDQHSTQVLWFEYDAAGQVTAVRDYTDRRVQYHYSGEQLTAVTDVMGNSWSYEYGQGQLLGKTDPEGRTTRLTYSGTGMVTSIKDPDGAVTTYSYTDDSVRKLFQVQVKTAGGRVDEYWYNREGYQIRHDRNGGTIQSLTADTRKRTLTDAAGRTTVTDYDEWDNPVKITYPDGSTITYDYDRYSNITRQVDETGVVTLNEYNATGNVIRRTEAAGRPEQRLTEWTYDSFGQVLTETVKGGAVELPDGSSVTVPDATTRYEYDLFGNRITLTDAEGNISRTTYNQLGQATETIDARGNRWRASFDARGLRLTQTDPLNQVTTATYNKVGERLSRTDPLGAVWRYAYNARGRLIQTTDPLNNRASTTYDAEGQIVEETDFGGKVIRRNTYDRDGRALTREDALGNKIEYSYSDPAASGSGNSGDLPSAVSYPTFIQRTTYDARSRPITVVTEPKAAFNPGNTVPTLTTRYDYDAVGNRIGVTDSAGNVTRYAFDGLRRNTAVTDAAQGVTRFAFDPRDNLLAVRDANGNPHRMQVDRLGRKIRETRLGGETWQWSYDAVGNLATQIDALGQTTTHSYDAANRLSRRVIAAAPDSGVPNKTITYDYNAAGSLTAVNDGFVQHAIELDALQRKTAETINLNVDGSLSNAADTITHTYRYRYATAGSKSALVYPDGAEALYTHDANQQLTGIQLPQGIISTHYRNAYTQIETLYPGGSRSLMQLDALLRVASIDVKDPAQQTLMRYNYGFDVAGNITAQQTERGNHNFGYDALYRLTQASYGNGLSNDAFSYDLVHNRLTDATEPGAWRYNANNQLIDQGSAITWSYDANGQAIQKTPPGPSNSMATTRRFVYNPENRLAEVKDDDQTIAAYRYDPFGRRIAKTVTRENGAPLSTPKTIFFLYSDEGLLAETDSQGAITTQYGFVPDGLWGTNPIYRLDKANDVNTLLVYHTDHLGTPQQMTNTTGQVVWSQRQKAFGEMTVDIASTVTNNLRFPGQYFDQEMGTHYNFFRDYEPRAGRYVQFEPTGLAGGTNLYGYAYGNPYYYVDRDGRLVQIGVPALVLITIGVSIAIIIQSRQNPVAVPTPIPTTNSNNPPGDCSSSRHRYLQDNVDQLCHLLPPKCSPGESCLLMDEKIVQFTACANARKRINDECFRGGNRGHQIAYTHARQQAAICLGMKPTCCAP